MCKKEEINPVFGRSRINKFGNTPAKIPSYINVSNITDLTI
jgi:hypothetical protein